MTRKGRKLSREAHNAKEANMRNRQIKSRRLTLSLERQRVAARCWSL